MTEPRKYPVGTVLRCGFLGQASNDHWAFYALKDQDNPRSRLVRPLINVIKYDSNEVLGYVYGRPQFDVKIVEHTDDKVIGEIV